MASTVTIDKTYFDTLLRRAEFHGPATETRGFAIATIPRAEYNDLIRCSQEYRMSPCPTYLRTLSTEGLRDVLRQALCSGGVSEETLDILIHGRDKDNNGQVPQANSGGELDWWGRPVAKLLQSTPDPDDFAGVLGQPGDDSYNNKPSNMNGSFNAAHTTGNVRHTHPSRMDGISHVLSRPGFGQEELHFIWDSFQDDNDCQPWSETPQRKCLRADHTILLSNLPEGTTHRDVTSVLKGGRLLDIWLRKKEHTASVTFAEGASDFLAYAKRNDIYIGAKRIKVGWSERQFAVPSHLVNKLERGVSRNLIIRGASSNNKLTEEKIRADMEHIHNLVIIAVVWRGADVYISTNSVNNAMFARTCMTSRALYKGMKIEWYPDECAQLIPESNRSVNKENVQMAPIKNPSMITNRFNLLDMNDSDSSSEQRSVENESHMSGIYLGMHSAGTASTVV